jgi:hypothetical protein
LPLLPGHPERTTEETFGALGAFPVKLSHLNSVILSLSKDQFSLFAQRIRIELILRPAQDDRLFTTI